MVKAFDETKKTLEEATLLAPPCHDVLTSVTTDASDQEVGAVLQQFENGTWDPLAFFSMKLHVRPPKKKNNAIDRKLLALDLGYSTSIIS